ncbi:MAG: isoprenylcysteine carboxylmethyltransferase family protein, partial [Bacteroidia bacterium]|nr:isoprenylcysteine carboxylmethyltransferase family protein [Bacteroidia bacterium]
PIYSSLILTAAGYALSTGYTVKFLSAAGLCLVLYFKARYEESALASVYQDYSTYMRKTRRFVPFIV